MSEVSEREKQLRGVLLRVFRASIGDDTVTLERDARAAGVPAKFASAVSRASKAVANADQAADAADEWAARIDAALPRNDDLSPADLAALVPERTF